MTPTPHEPSGWLRGAVAAAARAVELDPTARACAHGLDPRPHCLTLHDQRLRCEPCAAAYGLALRQLDPAEDHTCDRCRRTVCDLTPVLLDMGPIRVALGLCGACLSLETSVGHAAR